MGRLTTLILVILLLPVGCGDGIDFPPLPTPSPTMAPSPSPTVTPTPAPTPEPTPTPPPDPIECEEGFTNGNLWKPKASADSSTPGLLVVLIRPLYREMECTAVRKGGQVEQLRFTGFANGNRGHYRGSRPGGDYKNNGTVTCTDCRFTFSGSSGDRHE